MGYNIGKCEVIHFGSKNGRSEFYLNGKRLQHSAVLKVFRSPYLTKDVLALETMQRMFTGLIPEIRGLACEERLNRLGLSVEKWLKVGVDPDLLLPDGIAALHLASGQDTEAGVRCLKLLLQHGADPNIRSAEDLTPLHVAASWGCIKCVKLLLRNGADPTLLDVDGLSAVDLARQHGNVKCCRILQDYFDCKEKREEDCLALQYVGFRRVSSGLHFFTNVARYGITDSHRTSSLPGKHEESHAEQSLTDSRWVFASYANGTGQGLSNSSDDDRLGEVTSVWSQSWGQSTKVQSPRNPTTIPEDKSEENIVGEATEQLLDYCVLSNITQQTLGGLHCAAVTVGDHAPADQKLTVQDDESFDLRAPPSCLDSNHSRGSSIDDESFLPPSATGAPLPGNHRLGTSTSPHLGTQQVPSKQGCGQQMSAVLHEKKGGDLSGDCEWISELDCTCALTEQSQASVSPSNTQHTGLFDSELVVRPHRASGITMTSPDHIYELSHANVTLLLDQMIAVPSEAGEHCTQVPDGDGCVRVECAQTEGGGSVLGNSPYYSCESGSEVFASAVGSVTSVRWARQDREDPVTPTDNGSPSTMQIPSDRLWGGSCSRSQSGVNSVLPPPILRSSVSQEGWEPMPTLPFEEASFVEESPGDYCLPGAVSQSMYSSPTQHCISGSLYSTLAEPGNKGNLHGGLACTNCGLCKERRVLMGGEGGSEQNRPIREPESIRIPVKAKGFPGSLMHSEYLSVQVEQLRHGAEGRTPADPEGSEGPTVEGEGGSGLAKRFKDVESYKGGPSLANEERLSPFVTLRTKSRLANSASIHDPLLFDQSVPRPTRIRRVRNLQDDTLTPDCSNVLQDGKDEDHSLSTCSSAENDAVFDTVPFVHGNGHWAKCVQNQGSICLVTANPKRSGMDVLLRSHDAGGIQNLQLRSVGSSPEPTERSQAERLVNELPPGKRASGTSEDRPCVPAVETRAHEELKVLESWKINKAVQLPSAPKCPSPQCLSLAPVINAQDKKCNMLEHGRFKGYVSQSENQMEASLSKGISHSLQPLKGLLSNMKWQSCLSRPPVPVSPGNRPVSCGESEPLEFLYTDAEGSHALIECCYPCKDTSFQHLAASSDDETIIYDWKTYQSSKVTPEEKENLWPSNEPPSISPRLHRLSNRQILKQLREFGEDPGPVTNLTRGVYLLHLHRIQKEGRPQRQPTPTYSPELAQTLDKFLFPDCSQDEMALVQQFDQPDPKRRWREGLVKSSFNYLLLDPRVTKNLPARSHTLTSAECFHTFVSSIFYVGKGKRSRPFSHLYQALTSTKREKQQFSGKLKHIFDIWSCGQGVISLHCFQNVIPVEAYTREACMVDALGLQMLTNKKRGDYYGVVGTWPLRRRRRLGVHMLKRAMEIFLVEGERQLRPADV
ncbi:uncharacterized protein [Narcine bancroftii]|uniref:uncharacterized protein n=1 Tax=Narcine bancroftii TaxID=1343680 RepID=UPI00383218D9